MSSKFQKPGSPLKYWKWLLASAVFLFVLVGIAVSASEFPWKKEQTLTFEESIQSGAQWFLENQDDTFLHYEYLPLKRAYSDSNQQLRQMGAMWVLAKLGNSFPDDRYTALADKGFTVFEKFFKNDETNDTLMIDIEPGEIQLAYNALTILTLLELDHPQNAKYLEPLKKGILSTQQANGEFKPLTTSNRPSGIDYYPGEAMFALMALNETNPDPEIITAVAKAFPFYRDYWRGNKNTGFVPWQTRAYRKLYAVNGDPEVKRFVFEMNDWLVEQSLPRPELCADFKFAGIDTAVFIEGMVQAYDLAKESGDAKRMDCYGDYVRAAADYVRSLQDRNGKKYGESAVGGFMGKPMPWFPALVDENKLPTIRVDHNMHALMGFMEARQVGVIK